MFELLVLFGGISLILLGVYKWATKNNDYFAKRNLSFIEPYFIIGNFGGFLCSKYSLNEFIQYVYNAIPTAK